MNKCVCVSLALENKQTTCHEQMGVSMMLQNKSTSYEQVDVSITLQNKTTRHEQGVCVCP